MRVCVSSLVVMDPQAHTHSYTQIVCTHTHPEPTPPRLDVLFSAFANQLPPWLSNGAGLSGKHWRAGETRHTREARIVMNRQT